MKTRVLFVDDEPSILDGLRNVLRRQRHDWDMAFAVGAAAALDELANQPADVVVSDMCMPGVDGAALLERVRDLYPGTARIVLSGHAERDAIVRALPVAHQYLSKPFEADQLVSVINRTTSLHAHLDDPVLRGLIAGLDRLPSAPHVYLEITRVAALPNSTLEDISMIVERDPALVAKVLQVVNSAYFGLRRELASIREAVQYLGADILKGLALGGQVFGTATIKPFEGFSLEGLQRHSLHTARLARRLAGSGSGLDEVFTAAIVHDVGQIVLASGQREQFADVRRRARAENRAYHEVELETFGASHAGIGACLLGMWGLPFPIIEAAAYHHSPRLVEAGERKLLAAVHLADALVSAVDPDAASPGAEHGPDLGFLDQCGITPDLARWTEWARQEVTGEVSHGAK
jgi:HD-like signal output (HDOD) protein/ActR/RegA family two-component response regulator